MLRALARVYGGIPTRVPAVQSPLVFQLHSSVKHSSKSRRSRGCPSYEFGGSLRAYLDSVMLREVVRQIRRAPFDQIQARRQPFKTLFRHVCTVADTVIYHLQKASTARPGSDHELVKGCHHIATNKIAIIQAVHSDRRNTRRSYNIHNLLSFSLLYIRWTRNLNMVRSITES